MTQDEVDKYCESIAYNPSKAGGKRSFIYGVAVNDLPHITQIVDSEGKKRFHSGYNQWGSVVERVYSPLLKTKRPTYCDTSLCTEWLCASNFIEWQKTQYREAGWHLDKDLLVIGNKHYSPETCVYIPAWLNSFTTDCGSRRGKYLIGAAFHKRDGKFSSACGHPLGKREFVGYFDSEVDAHLAWRKRKLEIALELKPQMDAIDLRIYPNVVTIINNAR